MDWELTALILEKAYTLVTADRVGHKEFIVSEFLRSPDSPELPAQPDNPLQLTDEEARQHALASQPGWTPPARPEQVRPLTEKIIRVVKIVNLLHARGRRSLTAADLGVEFVKLGWKNAWTVNNALGDVLGKSGLRLQVIGSSGGNNYRIPDVGITQNYLRSIGYDV